MADGISELAGLIKARVRGAARQDLNLYLSFLLREFRGMYLLFPFDFPEIDGHNGFLGSRPITRAKSHSVVPAALG
jgi:hypothetical protein